MVSRMQRLQNNVTPIVFKAYRRCDARPLLQQLHWLPVESRVNQPQRHGICLHY